MKTGKKLKEKGQQLALEHAGLSWTETMMEKLKAFCKARKDLDMPEFKIENLRDVAIASGWPLPRSAGAWGAFTTLASDRGLIAWTGKYESASSPKTRCHPVRVWKAI